jgi:K+-sensing histidine kinase KdpD
MYGANQDITERRQAAQQLAEAKARTDAANRELEQSLARQQELEKLKEQLVGLLVHDLKSPLGSVLVNATYLNSEDCTESEQMPLIADVIVATQTMRRMVMDMLDVMRADGAGLVPRRRVIEVEALLKEAARPAIAQARESRHDITIGVCPKLVHAWVDPDLIRRVLENLLDNALKYAPEGTGIEVRADTAEDQLVLQVRDQGPGIPEAERGRIFEPYARLAGDADTKTRQSRGLGLAFCKLAVEAHGGSISVHERIPRGAVFTVRLPVTRPGPAD